MTLCIQCYSIGYKEVSCKLKFRVKLSRMCFDKTLVIEILTHFFDIVCNQPILNEKCEENHPRLHSKWYYDKFKGKCEPFNPGECSANENSFRTETECQMQCTGNLK